ncbi:hypothetical protein BDN70DRAFT_870972 [Pholiota conissans]|uniref:Uncharacterized protein n=1 Tax=Pholiota conissans TaxID=109636 RepID=A0A9P6D6K0_9AGAR|nr:hypothetical protein BDN70DRAFT_870972 [Pholiota conissans]
MQRQSLLVRETPLDALCHHFNVHPTPYTTNEPLGPTFDMHVVRDAHMPTHVLAVTSPDQPATPPLMLPIDATLFARGFPLELNVPPAPPGSTAPIPRYVGPTQMVNLPVIELSVPHVSTLPLLLLYGMALETETNLLSWSLLPVNVVEEFPNAAAMSLVLSRHRDERFERVYNHNAGIWKNILAMGFNDPKILQLVQTAWNVTAEARRIRQRLRI